MKPLEKTALTPSPIADDFAESRQSVFQRPYGGVDLLSNNVGQLLCDALFKVGHCHSSKTAIIILQVV